MRRSRAGLWSAGLLLASASAGLASTPCAGVQLGSVEVTQSARTLDGSRAGADAIATYRSLIAAAAGTAGRGRGMPVRLEIRLASAERRLTSAYLNGDQWPLRTVSLSLSAAAVDPRSGKRLAEMDLPNLALAGSSTFEAVSKYLQDDFAQPLANMLAVACEGLEPQPPTQWAATPAPMPAQYAAASPRVAAFSRGGEAPSAAVTAPTRIAPGRHIAVVIGVSRYLVAVDDRRVRADVTNLRYADHDAQDVADVFRQVSTPGRSWEVRSLINEQATKTRVQDTLRQAFEGAQQGDVIVLFFAGHGLNMLDRRDVSLLPYDFDPANSDSAVSFNWIKREMDGSNALQVIGFVDACNSGSLQLTARSGGAQGLKLDQLDQLATEQRIGRMRTILTSTSNGELAYEDPALQHGVFSYFLLKALRGDAGDRSALGPTFDYVTRNVSQYVTSNRSLFGNDATQHPTYLGNLSGDFVNWRLP